MDVFSLTIGFSILIFVAIGLSLSLPSIKLLREEISRRAKAEEELKLTLSEIQILAEKAERANTAKSNFLASMSHELRTPLNAIIGFAEMMALPNLVNSKERQQEYHEIIVKSGRHLLALINDILDLSKIEEGKFKRSISDCCVNDILREALETIHLPAREKNLTLAVSQAEVRLVSDEKLLKQIFINLLSNAVKFSKEGGEIEIVFDDHSGGLSVMVKDHGIGMTDNELARVTEPFFQVEEAYNRTVGGSGLGMALVKRFVEFLEGELIISSIKDEGTIINLEIPNLVEAD